MDNCIAESGQQFECNFKRFKAGIGERKVFLEHHQNIFIFSAALACSSSCKIVVISKRPLIEEKVRTYYSLNSINSSKATRKSHLQLYMLQRN